jgi:thiol-disulfide isomerase/thioredoxin
MAHPVPPKAKNRLGGKSNCATVHLQPCLKGITMSPHFQFHAAYAVGLTILLNFGSASCNLAQAQEATAEATRVWRDASGQFEVSAELKSQDKSEVVLLSAKGKEIRVKKSRLSKADLAYLRSLASDSTTQTKSSEPSDATAADQELLASLKEKAQEFYDDLRTTERAVAIELLTPSARELAKSSDSGFGRLPKPDDGKQSVKVGKPTVQDGKARVPVIVKVEKKVIKTVIYFSKDDSDNWFVTEIGSIAKNKETKISFEASTSKAEEKDSVESLVGKPIELTGVTLKGSPVSLKELKGKVVLIDFWATWCGPCLAEIPNIKTNYEKYHDAGFEVIAVSVDKDLKALAKFVKEEQPPWIVLADRHAKNKESMSQKFGISGIPAFILVDRDGKVSAVNCRGKRLGENLEKLLSSDVSTSSD